MHRDQLHIHSLATRAYLAQRLCPEYTATETSFYGRSDSRSYFGNLTVIPRDLSVVADDQIDSFFIVQQVDVFAEILLLWQFYPGYILFQFEIHTGSLQRN
jgi:hypothetical protein